MKPLAYGYMRVQEQDDDPIVRATELKLRRFAEANGYEFAAVFHEDDNGRYEAFTNLLTELQRAEAHDVLVPAISDFSRHHLLSRLMIDKLWAVAAHGRFKII